MGRVTQKPQLRYKLQFREKSVEMVREKPSMAGRASQTLGTRPLDRVKTDIGWIVHILGKGKVNSG